jgi:hypothetical protein
VYWDQGFSLQLSPGGIGAFVQQTLASKSMPAHTEAGLESAALSAPWKEGKKLLWGSMWEWKHVTNIALASRKKFMVLMLLLMIYVAIVNQHLLVLCSLQIT